MTSGIYPNGRLIMAANAIGRPEDIPVRSLDALRTADLVIFEEDRPARQALKAAGIHRDYRKLNEHGDQGTLDEARSVLAKGGTVCYMSDQGTPILADPGHELTALAYRIGAHVMAIPGPSSVTAALAACPFLTGPFHFAGFLARDAEERRSELSRLRSLGVPVVLLDTPYRLGALLESCAEVWGETAEALLALDISGMHETFHMKSLQRLGAIVMALDAKLNFVLVLPPAPDARLLQHKMPSGGSTGRRSERGPSGLQPPARQSEFPRSRTNRRRRSPSR